MAGIPYLPRSSMKVRFEYPATSDAWPDDRRPSSYSLIARYSLASASAMESGSSRVTWAIGPSSPQALPGLDPASVGRMVILLQFISERQIGRLPGCPRRRPLGEERAYPLPAFVREPGRGTGPGRFFHRQRLPRELFQQALGRSQGARPP